MIYVLATTFTCLISYFLFPTSLNISRMAGAIDYPSSRKSHITPTARGGGLTFFIAFSIILLMSPIIPSYKIPLLFGGITIFVVGFLDDTLSLSPFSKLAGQFLAISVYFFTSELLGYNISIFQSILSSIWIIFITNAVNIIDGLDGLASGVCSSEAMCLAVMSFFFENNNVFLCSILLLGAILGFIPRNFPKAKIFMGDCGALFLGFTLAVLSSRLVIESNNIIYFFSIMLVFRIPTYDTNISIIRRLIHRKNPFKADKEHLHHLLIKHGFTKECATLAIVTVSLFFGFLGIIISLASLNVN